MQRVRSGIITTIASLIVAVCVGCGPVASGTSVPSPTPTATSPPDVGPSPKVDTTTPTPITPPRPSPTPPPAPDKVTLQVAGQVGGQSLAVAVEGSTAYLGVGPRLMVLDVSPPDAPQLLGQSGVLSGVVRDIAVVGEMAYVAAGDAGLRVLDVSDPSRPHEIGSAPTAGEAQVVFVRDHIAYVAEGKCKDGDCGGNLSVVDISDPATPSVIGFLEMPGSVNRVVVEENYAYVAHDEGLQVVDVSDPVRPRAVGAFTQRGVAKDIAIAGGHAYVISGPEVLVMDLSTPADPQEIGSSSMMFSPNVAAVAGDYLYVCDGFCEFGQCGSHLRVLDVSDLAEPREVSSLSLEDLAVDVVVVGDLAYVVTWENGLKTVDLTNVVEPRLVGTVQTLGSVRDITVSEAYAYATSGGENGLLVLDLTDPTFPQTVGALPTLPFAGAVALVEGYAYVPAWVEGLRVVNVTEPTDPREVSSLDSSILQGTVDRVALGDDALAGSEQAYAYLTVQEGGLMVLDTADPSHPHPIAAYTPSRVAIRGVAVADGYAYATGSHHEQDHRKGTLFVIDVVDPASPQEIASIELPEHSLSSVTVAGDYVYVALADCYYFTCSGNLQVIDVTDPAQPHSLGSLDVPGGGFGVTVVDDDDRGNRSVYVTAGKAGVWVVDVSDPAEPHMVGLANTPGDARGIAVVDDLVYVGDGRGGFLVLRVIRSLTPVAELCPDDGIPSIEAPVTVDLSNWRVYEDDERSFRFRYPEGWRVEVFDSWVGVGPAEMGEDVQWGVRFFDSSDTTIEQVISDVGRQFGSDRTEVRECVYVDNIAAIKAIVTTSQIEDWYSESIVFEHQGTLFEIGNGAVHDERFQAFYDSFRLNR